MTLEIGNSETLQAVSPPVYFDIFTHTLHHNEVPVLANRALPRELKVLTYKAKMAID